MIVFPENERQKQDMAIWLSAKLSPYRVPDEFAITASICEGGIGMVLYHDYYENVPTIHMDCAGEGNWLNRGALHEFFRYPFEQLGCLSVWTFVNAANTTALAFNDRVGFKREGIRRASQPGGGDSVVFGMLRHECRWLGADNETSRRAA